MSRDGAIIKMILAAMNIKSKAVIYLATGYFLYYCLDYTVRGGSGDQRHHRSKIEQGSPAMIPPVLSPWIAKRVTLASA